MKLSKAASMLAIGAAAAGVLSYVRYRRELGEIRERIARGARVVLTRAGPVEYALEGRGRPLLMIHGAGGGYDQGLLIARGLADGCRIISPSRFGYLGTPIPDDHSIAAQAEAHCALLDHLQVGKAIVAGASAGAPSAIELALRHPDRVAALILLAPRTYDPTGSMGVDRAMPSQAVLRIVEASADFMFWFGMRAARGAIVRFLGVPPQLERSAPPAERQRMTEVMTSVLPLSDRVRGIDIDSSATLQPWPLDKIQVPTLIVSAEDDLFQTLPGARFTAAGIPDAQLEILDSGGHLMLGQQARVRALVEEFLGRVLPRDKAEPAAMRAGELT